MLYLTKINQKENTARAKHIRSLINANISSDMPIKFVFYNFKKPLKNIFIFIKSFFNSFKKKEIIYTRDIEFTLLCYFFKKKVIYEIHQYGMIRKTTRFSRINKIILFLLSNSKNVKFVTLTKGGLRVLKYLFPYISNERLYIIPDAGDIYINDTSFFKKLIFINNQARLNIAYAGSFLPGKGGLETLKLAKRLKKYQFNLAGDSNKLQEKKFFIYSNINLVGYLNDFEISNFYAQNDVLIAPIGKRIFLDNGYLNEITFYTSPLKLFEYLSTNKPVITIDRPCTRIMKNFPGLWFIDKENSCSIKTWIEVLEEVKEFIKSKKNKDLHDLRKPYIYNWQKRIIDMKKII